MSSRKSKTPKTPKTPPVPIMYTPAFSSAHDVSGDFVKDVKAFSKIGKFVKSLCLTTKIAFFKEGAVFEFKDNEDSVKMRVDIAQEHIFEYWCGSYCGFEMSHTKFCEVFVNNVNYATLTSIEFNVDGQDLSFKFNHKGEFSKSNTISNSTSAPSDHFLEDEEFVRNFSNHVTVSKMSLSDLRGMLSINNKKTNAVIFSAECNGELNMLIKSTTCENLLQYKSDLIEVEYPKSGLSVNLHKLSLSLANRFGDTFDLLLGRDCVDFIYTGTSMTIIVEFTSTPAVANP